MLSTCFCRFYEFDVTLCLSMVLTRNVHRLEKTCNYLYTRFMDVLWREDARAGRLIAIEGNNNSIGAVVFVNLQFM